MTISLLAGLVGCSDESGQGVGAAGNGGVADSRGVGGAGAGGAGGMGSGAVAGSQAGGAAGVGASGGLTGAGGADGGAPGPNPPGSACSCDSECAGDASHPGVCVFGVCMTQATGSCQGGSADECGPGSHCWRLRGQAETYLCWPDCASFACEGMCDGDGSCTYPANGTCDPTCGTHCPPEAGPCSLDNPMGFCDAGQECVNGVCTTPCSPASPTGYCPPGRMCEAGVCTNAAGCPDWECTGSDCSDIILMPGSQDPNSAQALEDGYFLDHQLKYSYVRRDLTLLTAWAACEVKERFPHQTPLGLGDLSQADGLTPGTDVGQLRHGSSTHRGNDMDIAYYQTDGLNNTQIICGDGSDTNGNACCGAYNDGKFCTTEENIVDWPPQAFFFAKMAVSPETRVFGIDQTLVDDFNFHLDQLVASGDITQAERDYVTLGYGAPGGWQYHHHHVHLSYCRIGGCSRPDMIGEGDFLMERIVSPWFEPDQSKGGMAPPPAHSDIVESLLDAAVEVPTIAEEKGFRIRPRPSSQATH